MNPKTKLYAAKYTVYAVMMIFLYVMQTTPGFLTVFSVRPNLVACAAMVVAMMEGEFTGGLYGVLAGVLCDLGAFTIFGFNAVIFMISCVLAGLLVIYLLRMGVVNYVLLLFGMLAARGLLDYLLNFLIWGYDDVHLIFLHHIAPTVLYSTAVSPVVYYLYRMIYNRFEVRIQE